MTMFNKLTELPFIYKKKTWFDKPIDTNLDKKLPKSGKSKGKHARTKNNYVQKGYYGPFSLLLSVCKYILVVHMDLYLVSIVLWSFSWSFLSDFKKEFYEKKGIKYVIIIFITISIFFKNKNPFFVVLGMYEIFYAHYAYNS